MKVVVVTGSTRGLGLGLANSFLDLGCAVVISGRTVGSVERTNKKLLENHDSERILFHPCDVRQVEQHQDLWDRSVARFGKVDIWINNAGIATSLRKSWLVAPEQVNAVVDTNVVGSIYGAGVAINGMLTQGHGALYNVEGMGSNGRKQEGLTVYGTSKAAVRYFTEALVLETEDTPVLVGSISPGMLATDLVIDQFREDPDRWQRSKRVLGLIMDDVRSVSPWLAERILLNKKHGVRIAWLTRTRLVGRFLAAPFGRRPTLGDVDDYQ